MSVSPSLPGCVSDSWRLTLAKSQANSAWNAIRLGIPVRTGVKNTFWVTSSISNGLPIHDLCLNALSEESPFR